MAFKFGGSESKVIRNILVGHGFHEVHPNSPDFNVMWTNTHLKPFTLRSLTDFQKVNHFPRSEKVDLKKKVLKKKSVAKKCAVWLRVCACHVHLPCQEMKPVTEKHPMIFCLSCSACHVILQLVECLLTLFHSAISLLYASLNEVRWMCKFWCCTSSFVLIYWLGLVAFFVYFFN